MRDANEICSNVSLNSGGATAKALNRLNSTLEYLQIYIYIYTQYKEKCLADVKGKLFLAKKEHTQILLASITEVMVIQH